MIQKRDDSGERNDERGGRESASERAQKVEPIAQAEVRFLAQEKRVGHDKKSASQEAEREQKDEDKNLGRPELQGHLKEDEERDEPELDEEKMGVVD